MADKRIKPGWAIVLGILAVATLPVAIAATRFSGSFDLLQAGFAVPLAACFGWWAILRARMVRGRLDATLGDAPGRRGAGVARALGIVGLCMASSGAISLAVYGVLKLLE